MKRISRTTKFFAALRISAECVLQRTASRTVPQGLKPPFLRDFRGTAEAVPLRLAHPLGDSGALGLAVLALAMLAVPPLRALQLDVAPAAAALGSLEARLTADPDNLQLGSQYRKEAIRLKEFDRAIEFFEQLVAAHPNGANTALNFGFSYVDKVPAAGSITQVILANNALGQFTKSIELRPSWIALYTRGNSYLYWPKIFGRASLGVADLEEAMKMQKADRKRAYHVRTYIALGDGHWKMDALDKARAVWAEGLREFPGNPQLTARLTKEGDDLKAVMDDAYDITKRIDTSLEELWAE